MPQQQMCCKILFVDSSTCKHYPWSLLKLVLHFAFQVCPVDMVFPFFQFILLKSEAKSYLVSKSNATVIKQKLTGEATVDVFLIVNIIIC